MATETIKKIVYILANRLAIPTFFRCKNKDKLLVVTYHGISDIPLSNASLPHTFIRVDDFRNQIEFLVKHYRILSPLDLEQILLGKNNLPPKSALITFDDAYESFYRLAQPILKSHEIKPIVFLPTAYLEDRKPFWFDVAWYYLKYEKESAARELWDLLYTPGQQNNSRSLMMMGLQKLKKMGSVQRDQLIDKMLQSKTAKVRRLERSCAMTWDQASELTEQGVAYGGHTHTHTILTLLTKNEVKKEIDQNKKIIESKLQVSPIFFAYPNGEEGDFDKRDELIIKEAAYLGAFSLTGHLSVPIQNPLSISRINIGPAFTRNVFATRCSGFNLNGLKHKQYKGRLTND